MWQTEHLRVKPINLNNIKLTCVYPKTHVTYTWPTLDYSTSTSRHSHTWPQVTSLINYVPHWLPKPKTPKFQLNPKIPKSNPLSVENLNGWTEIPIHTKNTPNLAIWRGNVNEIGRERTSWELVGEVKCVAVGLSLKLEKVTYFHFLSVSVYVSMSLSLSNF